MHNTGKFNGNHIFLKSWRVITGRGGPSLEMAYFRVGGPLAGQRKENFTVDPATMSSSRSSVEPGDSALLYGNYFYLSSKILSSSSSPSISSSFRDPKSSSSSKSSKYPRSSLIGPAPASYLFILRTLGLSESKLSIESLDWPLPPSEESRSSSSRFTMLIFFEYFFFGKDDLLSSSPFSRWSARVLLLLFRILFLLV